MSYCVVCGAYSYVGECRECVARYKNDLVTGHVPKIYAELGEEFPFCDWASIKQEEIKAAAAGLSIEKTRKRVNAVIHEQLAVRIKARQREQAKGQVGANFDELFTRFSTY